MSGLELNKLAASVLVAGLIAMVVGNVTDALYHPNLHPQTRGYKIEVPEGVDASQTAAAPADAPIDIPALLAKADVEKGKSLTKVCTMCHNFEEGQGPKIGPDLWDVVGKAKLHGSYDYSAAMKAKGGDWTYDDLYHFLNSPQKFIPGTKMTFAGYKKPEDVANVIAYLRTLSNSPYPLPN